MKFVSYAQNDEDVLLWRALKSVERGFYIDVGAAIIDDYSVSRAFYEHGWRGVNIEPVAELCEALRAAQPEDVTLSIALGSVQGERDLFIVPETGLSTLDPVIAETHRANGWTVIPRRVRVNTLAAICRQFAKNPIHFLKIDVEGAEAEVLAGADFSAFRPWILVIESTWPGRAETSHTTWEPGLLGANYRFAWFDGLNRYYVAAEQEAHLAPSFRLPPNVWDEFVRFDGTGERKLAAAVRERRQIESVLADKEREFAASKAAASAEAFGLRRAYFEKLQEQEQLARKLREIEAENRRLADELKSQRTEAERLIAGRPPAAGSPGAESPGQYFAPSDPAATAGSRPRALIKTLLRPLWRVMRPLVRPLAWRVRGFLLGPTQQQLNELSGLQQRLAELSDQQHQLAQSARFLVEHAEAGAATATLEKALLTIALSGEVGGPDRTS